MIQRTHGRIMVTLAIAILVAMSFVGALRLSTQAEAYSGVSVSVQNPSFAGMSETIPVTIIVTGGPAADIGGNYSYKEVEMTGKNTTGWRVDQLTQTSESGIFKFNITMPGEAGQTVEISLNATSKEWKTQDESYTTTNFRIKVVEPIVITAAVYNKGVVDATNVTADIYADGLLLDTQVFNVSAGAMQTVAYNWTFSSIKNGKHVVTVKIDDPNDLVEFSDGNNEYSITVYVGEQGNPAGAILTVGLMIAIVLFVLTYLQKPAKRGKKA